MQQTAPAAKAPGAKSLKCLHSTTDTLSSLLAQEVKELNSRQRTAQKAGDGGRTDLMKSLKEATAVLKDLAAVAKTLNEQGAETAGAGACGVVLLPPAETETEDSP